MAGADRFDEAQAAYKRAGKPEESLKLLTALAECAQVERRFESAARYYRQLSQEHLRVAQAIMQNSNDGNDQKSAQQVQTTNTSGGRGRPNNMALSPGGSSGIGGTGGTQSAAVITARQREKTMKMAVHRVQSEESVELAGVYFAYALVHQFTEDPFTHLSGDVVFSACCYLMNTLTCKSFRNRSTALHLSGLDPPGVSRVHVLYALARTCILETTQAYKLARWAIQQLQHQAVPSLWQNQIDRTFVTIQSKPFSDREGLAITCNRCLHTNPLINNIGTGDKCVNCSQPFYRCYGTFDVLPFVAFAPADGISLHQAVKLLSQTPGSSADDNSNDAARVRQEAQQRNNDSNNNGDGGSFDGDILGGMDSFDDGYSNSNRQNNSGAGYGRGAYGRGNGGSNSNNNSNSSSSRHNSSSRSTTNGGEEAFHRQLMKFEPGKSYTKVIVDSKMLLEMNGEDCILIAAPNGDVSYVRNMLPGDTDITVCTGCGCYFRSMSFEFAYLRDGGCPFCKKNNTGTDLDDVETRAIEAQRKQAIARGEEKKRHDDWEVISVTMG